jgi:hypothetical protein
LAGEPDGLGDKLGAAVDMRFLGQCDVNGRVLVVAWAEEDRMPQVQIVDPLGESDLCDQLDPRESALPRLAGPAAVCWKGLR